MTTITVSNPYYEKTYRVDMDKQKVLNSLYNCIDYPEHIASFVTKDEYGKECTIFINPHNFASVKVMEEE